MDNLNYSRKDAVSFNASDLNRIEEWTETLAEYLNSIGYSVLVYTRRWTEKDIPWRSEIDRVRGNIEKLYKAFQYNPDWKEIAYTGSLDYIEANVMEWDLHTMYVWLERMQKAFFYSNEGYCSEGGIA